METLTCSVCGRNWKRAIVRGVKPKTCPKCKGKKAKK